VLLSSDKDFFAIAAQERTAGQSFSGVLSVPTSLSYRAAIDDLELVAQCSDPGEWKEQLTRLPL
jgi:hypothetical protein